MPFAVDRTLLALLHAQGRELSKVVSFTERYGGGASLNYVDVNELKTINDTYGHAAGDEALLTVAKRLLEQVRETDVVGRLGGDEFGVILAQTDKSLRRRPAWDGQAASLAHIPTGATTTARRSMQRGSGGMKTTGIHLNQAAKLSDKPRPPHRPVIRCR